MMRRARTEARGERVATLPHHDAIIGGVRTTRECTSPDDEHTYSRYTRARRQYMHTKRHARGCADDRRPPSLPPIHPLIHQGACRCSPTAIFTTTPAATSATPHSLTSAAGARNRSFATSRASRGRGDITRFAPAGASHRLGRPATERPLHQRLRQTCTDRRTTTQAGTARPCEWCRPTLAHLAVARAARAQLQRRHHVALLRRLRHRLPRLTARRVAAAPLTSSRSSLARSACAARSRPSSCQTRRWP